jgi:hypothetical protein
MADSPTFADEEEFLKKHEQTKMWRTLSKWFSIILKN